MSLHGIGIDLVDVRRFRSLLARYGHSFERRWFAPAELAQPGERALCLARSYAVKEAVWKGLRLASPAHLAWRDIVATVESGSQVEVRLEGRVGAGADAIGVACSASDVVVRGDLVIATAIVWRSRRCAADGTLFPASGLPEEPGPGPDR